MSNRDWVHDVSEAMGAVNHGDPLDLYLTPDEVEQALREMALEIINLRRLDESHAELLEWVTLDPVSRSFVSDKRRREMIARAEAARGER